MEYEFQIILGPEQVRALSYAVSEAIRLWPGAPARPIEEQEELQALKNSLFAMQMDMVFEQNGKRGEGDSPS